MCTVGFNETVAQVVDKSRLEVVLLPPRPVGVSLSLKSFVGHGSPVIVEWFRDSSSYRRAHPFSFVNRTNVNGSDDDYWFSISHRYQLSSNITDFIMQLLCQGWQEWHDHSRFDGSAYY